MKFIVVYQVKYSELWCADECHWIEHSSVIKANSKLEARKLARKELESYPRLIRGRHIETRRVNI